MRLFKSLSKSFSAIKKYRYKLVMFTACSWTLIDLIIWIRFMNHVGDHDYQTIYEIFTPFAVLLRLVIVFLMSLVMGYMLVFRLKRMYRNYPLIANLFLKTLILLFASFLMNFLLHFSYSSVVLNADTMVSLSGFYRDSLHTPWLWENTISWMVIFLITQLLIEINEKYSPGVFLDMLVGKYINPQIEKRIIMFLDLKDSTPIAEKLGHTVYFRFIRDFVYYISTALLEYDGRIYQYVGDEIVVSWPFNNINSHKCIYALLDARRMLQKNAETFKRKYGIIPEFKVGIHAGEVTVGEIGVVKRDLAMSGDTMNTTARIRTACTELNHKYIVSKDFRDSLDMADWQCKSLGSIELKGKSNTIELFALVI
jgi:adenylate cyclase